MTAVTLDSPAGVSPAQNAVKGPHRVSPLREELIFREGPDAEDGSPTWVLEDPSGDRFFQIGAKEGEMLMRWPLKTAERIAAAVNAETLFRVTPEDVLRFNSFLEKAFLTFDAATAQRLIEKERQKKPTTLWQFFLHHYLFFRVPLVHPDAFLTRTVGLVEKLFLNRVFPALTLFIALLSVYLIGRQWDTFVHTFQGFLTWQGAAAMAVTLAFTKTVHELGHAYVAKHFGCRIPNMGVAFMVMMPLLYTDTTGAWRLKKKKERLLIVASGVLSEMTLGAWAAFFWSFTPDGLVRSSLFMLAATTWVMSLAVNMMPFMRFDGYYFLSDLTGVANLHQRSFALARQALRRLIFRFEEPTVERFSPAKTRFLIGYAWATWIYRFVLFMGIALLVYYAFFKVLGIVLFAVEMTVFVVGPIVKEMKDWVMRLGKEKSRPHWVLIGGVLTVLFLWLFFPWNSQVTAPAVLRASGETGFYAAVSAMIKSVSARPGLAVKKGDVLYELESPKLENEARKLTDELAAADWRIGFLRVNRETAAEVPVAERERAEIVKRLTEVRRQLSALTVKSPFDGVILETQPDLSAGEWVRAGEKLAVGAPVAAAADGAGLVPEVWGYMAESDLLRVKAGSSALFVPEDAGRRSVRVTLQSIDRAATRQIGAAPELASNYGGPLAASVASDAAARSLGVDAGRAYALKDAVYRVKLTASEPFVLTPSDGADYDTAGTEVIRGHVVIDGERESLAGRWLRYGWAVLMRESGF